MATTVQKTLGEAVEELRKDPTRTVRAEVDGLIIELRRVAGPPAPRHSAADVFRQLGPWEGESDQEIRAILAAGRREGVVREVGDL